MKRRVVVSSLLILSLVSFMLFASCNGGGGGTTGPSQLYSVTGDWFAIAAGMGNLVLHLVENNGVVTGTIDRSVPTGGYDYGVVTTGTNNNNAVSITFQFADTQILVLNGTVTSATQMNGTSQSYYPGDPPNTWSNDTWGADKQ